MFSGKIEPATVIQSSTWYGKFAERAIDGDLETKSETQMGWNTDLWFKMKFDDVLCFSKVVIIQSYLNNYAFCMEDAKVFVVNTDEGTENLCGVLKVSGPVMTIEGQTYNIPCHLKCGNEVKVTLRHDKGLYSSIAIINMKEIMAYGTGMSRRLFFIEISV